MFARNFAYAAILFAALATDAKEVRARDFRGDDAITVSRTLAQNQSEKLRAIDVLFDSGLRREVNALRDEVTSLQRQLDLLQHGSRPRESSNNNRYSNRGDGGRYRKALDRRNEERRNDEQLDLPPPDAEVVYAEDSDE